MRRSRVFIAVILVMAATVLVMPAQAQATQATQTRATQTRAIQTRATQWKWPAVVSLGDSYISGEAGRWKGNSADATPGHAGTDRAYNPFLGSTDPARVYGATSGACDRSDVAPIISARLPGLKPINLACAGAKTVNVLRAASGGVSDQGELPQNDQLAAVAADYRVKVIVLSIGGNDLGFSPILQSCIAAYLFSKSPCSQTQQATIDAKLPGMEQNVEAVIDDIRGTMADAGYASGSYRIIFQSYPSPLAPAADLRYPQGSAGRVNIGSCPFYDQDADWTGRNLIPQITAAQSRAAHAKGVQFLDLEPLMQGHQLCSKEATQPTGAHARPRSATSEWIRFIDLAGQGTSSESLHPNYFGQQAIGHCLALAVYAARNASCYGTPHRPPWSVHL